MSTITITGVPAAKAAPRGAVWAAKAAVAAWAALRGLFGARRSERSPELDAAIEAARIRAMARRHAATDPGFAADLQAAADRHEAAASR
jgi:hypothetical protein